jgi:hypothetical protein
MECNKAKSALTPTNPSEVVLHPYFDDISKETWLTARVVRQKPCAFIFDVIRPSSWNDTTEARARSQFARLSLGKLYASQAAHELSLIRKNLQMHLGAGGDEAVRRELQRQWASRISVRVNSWQAAMYHAMASDGWFCNGGFA